MLGLSISLVLIYFFKTYFFLFGSVTYFHVIGLFHYILMRYIYIYIHIYIEREGGGEKERESSTNITIWLDMIYIKR